MSSSASASSSTESVTNIRCITNTVGRSNQNLWNLLRGKIVLAADDVFREELDSSLGRITAALTYYKPYEGDDEPVIFSQIPAVFRAAMERYQSEPEVSESDDPDGRPLPNSKRKTSEGASNESALHQISKATAQKLKIDYDLATELVVSFMTFEYKGPAVTFPEIAESVFAFQIFFNSLKVFYRNERHSLLLCIQSILSSVGDENHKFHKFIESFRSRIDTKKWAWGLLRSFDVAEVETEITEIFHCLALLMFQFPGTIHDYFAYLTNIGFKNVRKGGTLTKMAEGVAMYSALVVSGSSDCCKQKYPTKLNGMITDFLTKNFDIIINNGYNMVPLFASYIIFCKDNPDVTAKMKSMACTPTEAFPLLCELVDYYEKKSLRDCYNLSSTLSKGVFEALEPVLFFYDSSHFGTLGQAVHAFSTSLQHPRITESFLCSTPKAFTILYTGAISLFPLDIRGVLKFWKSFCMSVETEDSCRTIIKGVAKLNTIAELVTAESFVFMHRVDVKNIVNKETRELYGIPLEKNAVGTLNSFCDEQCVVWELPPTQNASAFEVLRWNLQLIAEKLRNVKQNTLTPFDTAEFDFVPPDIHAVARFVIQFWNSTSTQIVELTNLVHPICIIMESCLKKKICVENQAQMIQDLFAMIAVVNKFCEELALVNYLYGILPCGPNEMCIIEDLIVGQESLRESNFETTLAFLDLMSSFTEGGKCWELDNTIFSLMFKNSIEFIYKNIIVACTKWRTRHEGCRLQAYLKCFKIMTDLFSREDEEWTKYKQDSIRYLISSKSCLFMIFEQDDKMLDQSIITPTEENQLLGETVVAGQQLLLQMIRFEPRIINIVNSSLDNMLVRILARFLRHRFLPEIPSCVLRILIEVAQKTSVSFIACFGCDEAIFQEAILQRMQIAGEDVILRVAVLDFFTVITQTQIAVIEGYFHDGSLEKIMMDLLTEGHQDIAVACLRFFRSLIHQRLPLTRSIEGFWPSIMTPINQIRSGCRLDIITATFHILTFELYSHNDSLDPKLAKELEKLFKPERFGTVVEAIVLESDDVSLQCVSSLKHFLTMFIGRQDLKRFLPGCTLNCAQALILERLWQTNPTDNLRLSASLAELTNLLITSESANPVFISTLISNLGQHIHEYRLAVQLCLLCLVQKFLELCPGKISGSDIEILFRVLKKIFDISGKHMEEGMDTHPNVYSVLNVSSRIINTIIVKQPIDAWGSPLQQELIPFVLVHIASLCISRMRAPTVAANCLASMVSLAENPFGCKMISPSAISRGLYAYLYKLTDESVEDSSWHHVFFLCLSIKSKLLGNLKHLYLDDAIKFWCQHNVFLNKRLSVMSDLTELCVAVENQEKGYRDMKSVILYCNFVLEDVLSLVPYIEQWQAVQPGEAFKTIRLVYYILQESVGLIQQPYLLQTSAGIKTKTLMFDSKSSTPMVALMQGKLYDVANFCTQILASIKNCEDFIERTTIIPTVLHLGQLCTTAAGKIERKSPGAALAPLSTYISILEKILVIMYCFVVPYYDNPVEEPKFKNQLRRDMTSDVLSLCDSIRRLGSTRNDFVLDVCSKLDMKLR